MYIKNVVCAKDKLIVAQNTTIIVTGMEPLRPLASIIIPNRNPPTAIPIHNLIIRKIYRQVVSNIYILIYYKHIKKFRNNGIVFSIELKSHDLE